MRLATPSGFATEVFLLERPDGALLPEGPWTLVGDQRLHDAWTRAGLPEPDHALWVAVPEEEKRLRTVIPWLEHWAKVPLHRDATVVALGGGVLTDLTGLAASLYLRGVAWQVWPTTRREPRRQLGRPGCGRTGLSWPPRSWRTGDETGDALRIRHGSLPHRQT